MSANDSALESIVSRNREETPAALTALAALQIAAAVVNVVKIPPYHELLERDA